MSVRTRPRYEFGPFQLDPSEQLLLRNGKAVSLTPKAFDTLVLLIENSGHVVGKNEFNEKIWPDTFVEQGNLTVTISMLRKALGRPQNGQRYIETVQRLGYRFTASVRELNDAKPQRAGLKSKRPPAGNGKRGGTQAKGNRAQGAAGASANGDERGQRAAANAERRTGEVVRAAKKAKRRPATRRAFNSIAVLPLVNATDDPHAEYLSDGITENIINSLSQLPQLKVMARSTVFRYKGREVDAQKVGRELNVRAILTGRVLQIGDRLVIRTELVDVADGWHLWGEQFDRATSDILVVQAEIAREISENLRLKLSGEQKERLTKPPTESTEAYRAYLRGRHYWNRRTLEGLQKGVEFFEQAIALDANYALSYAGLADSYLLLGSVEYGALDPTVAMERAKQAATRALELDPTLAEAHASLAYVRVFDWDWAEAEREYLRAIELNPSYATAHHWYALYLTAMRRQEEALVEIKRAYELDPLSLPINVGVGWYYYLTRQYERAIEEYHKALELDANFYMAYFGLAMAYVQNFMYEEAIAAYQKALDISGGSHLMRAGTGHALAVSGRTKEARVILKEMSRRLKKQDGPRDAPVDRQYISPYYLAVIYASLGDKDEAFRWLEQACATRSEGLFWLQVDPMLDALRGDPRFAGILRCLRLLT